MTVTTTGLLHLNKTKATTATALDGTFSVMLVALDRQGTHRVEPWRITFSGPEAKAWWEREGSTLMPGDSIDCTLTHMRPHVLGNGWGALKEIHAQATRIILAARAGANGRQQAATA